jgi:exoribonuclease R
MDQRLPKLRLRSRKLPKLAGQRFVVRVDRWPQDSKYPVCHFVHALGPLNDLR